jgi:hypothetical protein
MGINENGNENQFNLGKANKHQAQSVMIQVSMVVSIKFGLLFVLL